MQTSAPRPVVTAPDPASGDDTPQVALVADTTLVQQPDFTVVQGAEAGNDADLGSSDRRALATQGVYSANSIAAVNNHFAPSFAPTSRGNASFATGFDRTPSFADHARTAGLTGPAAAYAATRASRS